MPIKSITQAKNLTNKTVLLRCDFDIPLKNNQIADDSRLRACLPTIEYLLKKKVRKIILIGHLGRPSGFNKKFSLQPIKKYLEKKLSLTPSINLHDIDHYLTKDIQKQINNNNSKIIMLENLRFSDRESANCQRFAKNLAALADLYINEAFAVSHRQATSISAIQKYLPSFAGLHLEQEIQHLYQILNKPNQPLTIIIGGAKIETKLPIIQNFQKTANYILIGGGVANNFIAAQNFPVGQSLIDKKYLSSAKKLLKSNFSKLILPVDVVVQTGQVKTLDKISAKDKILDLGPETINNFCAIIKISSTIVWNGPLGYFEKQKFAHATQKVAAQILKSQARCIIGGGETAQIFANKKIPANIFLSTGGGALLDFLAGKQLPGLKNLIK